MLLWRLRHSAPGYFVIFDAVFTYSSRANAAQLDIDPTFQLVVNGLRASSGVRLAVVEWWHHGQSVGR